MHNQEYIVSGMLELYAAGGLTPEERAEVESRAATSPEIRAALEEACATMEAYATQHARLPRPELKEKIMAGLSTAPAELDDLNPVILKPVITENLAFRWLLAASISLLLLFGYMSFFFYNKWQKAEDRLSTVLASEQLLATNMETASLRLQQQQTILEVYRNPAFKLITLAGVEAHPDAKLTVFWNPASRQLYVDQVQLPAAPAGTDYQLWALDNGKPLDAGLLSSDAPGSLSLQQMKSIASAQAFAVTLEPKGGSINPSLDQLMVMGKVES